MAANKVVSKNMRVAGMKLGLTGLVLAVLFLFLIPMFYGIVTSLKTDSQLSKSDAPWWPAAEGILNYEGKDYEIYSVPMEDGTVRELALYKKGRQVSEFLDPQNPEAGPIEWEGAWRQLERIWSFSPQWRNFINAWDTVNFPRLLWNTFVYASVTTFGAVFSSALVAYGFSRFRIVLFKTRIHVERTVYGIMCHMKEEGFVLIHGELYLFVCFQGECLRQKRSRAVILFEMEHIVAQHGFLTLLVFQIFGMVPVVIFAIIASRLPPTPPANIHIEPQVERIRAFRFFMSKMRLAHVYGFISRPFEHSR